MRQPSVFWMIGASRGVKQTIEQMFRHQVYSIDCGEEDLNHHQELRHDIALQTAVECNQPN